MKEAKQKSFKQRLQQLIYINNQAVNKTYNSHSKGKFWGTK